MKKTTSYKSKTKKSKKKQVAKFLAKKKSRFLKIATKIQAGLTLISLVFYVALGLFLGPPVILKDLSNKNKAIAATVNLSVFVIGLPEKPIVSAIADCGDGDPYITLDWGDDFLATTSYDIYRNDDILISGLTDSAYQDSTVLSGTHYTYYVIARGLGGNTLSDEVSANTENCVSDITCRITTLAGIPLINFHGIPKITDRTPKISGTTNLANALIEITLATGPTIFGNTTANANGYFSFTIPKNLDYKMHTIFVIARDPFNSSRFKQTSLKFKVQEKINNEEEKVDFNPSIIISPDESSETLENVPTSPFRLSLEIKNNKKTAYLGKELLINIGIYDQQEDADISAILLKIQIFDVEGNVVWESTETQDFQKNPILIKNIPLANDLKAGKYQIKVMTSPENTDYSLSTEDTFTLEEMIAIEVGSFSATATGILNYAGWIFFALAFILFFFLTMLYIEHHLILRASKLIDEYALSKEKYIS